MLDEHGCPFFFWLGWDSNNAEVAFKEWREVGPEPHWADDLEYLRARRRLGLPIS